MSDKYKHISEDKLIKRQARRLTIIRLMVENKLESSTRDMARRLLEEGLEVDKSTVARDYKDPEFKRMMRDKLFELFDTKVIYHAADNVVDAILEGDVDLSERLMERLGFYPPPELILRGRMEAPGDTEEKLLLQQLLSEGGIEGLKTKLDELLAMPDEDPKVEPEPDEEK